jgi:cell division transport system ATP-binding protein
VWYCKTITCSKIEAFFDNVALPLRITHLRSKDVERRVRGALSTVDLSDKGHLFPRHLSTGEQQRVGIARAVVNRPRIILADEPTGNLDPYLSRQVITLFHQFRDLGSTVLVASHDIDLIKDQGCRILHLSQGELVQGHRQLRASLRLMAKSTKSRSDKGR